MLNAKRKIYLTSFLIAICLLTSCRSIYESGFVPIPNQPISGPIEIGNVWIDIIPPKPLVSYKSTAIKFRGIDYDSEKIPLNDPEPLIFLKDGRITKLEVILYDDKGESYELRIGGLGNGVSFYRKATYEIVNGKKEIKLHAFPHDRTFTKLQVRSQLPIKCELIELVQWTVY